MEIISGNESFSDLVSQGWRLEYQYRADLVNTNRDVVNSILKDIYETFDDIEARLHEIDGVLYQLIFVKSYW